MKIPSKQVIDIIDMALFKLFKEGTYWGRRDYFRRNSEKAKFFIIELRNELEKKVKK